MQDHKTMFLEFFNDWLTLSAFASYYGIHEKKAQKVLNKGRVLHQDAFGYT